MTNRKFVHLSYAIQNAAYITGKISAQWRVLGRQIDSRKKILFAQYYSKLNTART